MRCLSCSRSRATMTASVPSPYQVWRRLSSRLLNNTCDTLPAHAVFSGTSALLDIPKTSVLSTRKPHLFCSCGRSGFGQELCKAGQQLGGAVDNRCVCPELRPSHCRSHPGPRGTKAHIHFGYACWSAADVHGDLITDKHAVQLRILHL